MELNMNYFIEKLDKGTISRWVNSTILTQFANKGSSPNWGISKDSAFIYGNTPDGYFQITIKPESCNVFVGGIDDTELDFSEEWMEFRGDLNVPDYLAWLEGEKERAINDANNSLEENAKEEQMRIKSLRDMYKSVKNSVIATRDLKLAEIEKYVSAVTGGNPSNNNNSATKSHQDSHKAYWDGLGIKSNDEGMDCND